MDSRTSESMVRLKRYFALNAQTRGCEEIPYQGTVRPSSHVKVLSHALAPMADMTETAGSVQLRYLRFLVRFLIKRFAAANPWRPIGLNFLPRASL